MKRLEIKNFVKRMDDIDSDYFGVRYCSNAEDKYIIGIDTNDVVNIKGVSYSQMMKIANDNPKLIKVEILKEYSKKISKY